LREGIATKLKINGISMFPTLRDGDIILLKPIKNIRRLQRGDIIFCETDTNKYVLHRIRRILNKNGTIQVALSADNMEESEESVNAKSVIGIAVALWRNGRKQKLFGLKNKLFHLICK